MPEHDFSQMECLFFKYTVPAVDEKSKPVSVTLDFERIGLDMIGAVPTLFEACFEDPSIKPGEMTSEVKTGMQILLENLQRPQLVPKSLPGIDQLLRAIEVAFRVPAHCTFNVKMALLQAWLRENAQRAELKKDVPVSPTSPELSPAA